MFRSLWRRLGAIVVGFLLLVAASVTATFIVIQTQQADAAIINLAGRQRMLSQRILWLALSFPDQQVLDQPVQLFDQTRRRCATAVPCWMPPTARSIFRPRRMPCCASN